MFTHEIKLSKEEVAQVDAVHEIAELVGEDDDVETLSQRGLSRQQAIAAFTASIINDVGSDMSRIAEKDELTDENKTELSCMNAFLGGLCMIFINTSYLIPEEEQCEEMKGATIIARTVLELSKVVE